MKLLTKEIKRQIPRFGETEKMGGQAISMVKFFTPDSNWTWYVVEGESLTGRDSNDDFEFFGLVDGHEVEMGYFRLSELKKVRGPYGLSVERDLYFKPTAISKLTCCPKWLKDKEAS